jgi:hypothetical protein
MHAVVHPITFRMRLTITYIIIHKSEQPIILKTAYDALWCPYRNDVRTRITQRFAECIPHQSVVVVASAAAVPRSPFLYNESKRLRVYKLYYKIILWQFLNALCIFLSLPWATIAQKQQISGDFI